METPSREELASSKSLGSRIALIRKRGLGTVLTISSILTALVVVLIPFLLDALVLNPPIASPDPRAIYSLLQGQDEHYGAIDSSITQIIEIANQLPPEQKGRDAIIELARNIRNNNSELKGQWNSLYFYVKPNASLGEFISFINVANAATAPQDDPNPQFQSYLRNYAYAGMICILAIVMIICLVAVFLTTDEKRFSFAVDTIKTLIGFFIGVISTLFGLPTS